MIQPLSTPVLLSLSVILILAFVGYAFIYPLKIIALFSFFFKKKKSLSQDVLALPSKPRIRISFDRSIKDDSHLIIELNFSLYWIVIWTFDLGSLLQVTPKKNANQLEGLKL